ncbi:MAG: alpha/beta fold hydrolase [Patescibacteria group bacterium]|nr:alpha/beta fold hydrolase [Patescibacteria group bacterium]
MPERVSFQTFDGVKIVAEWYPVPTTVGVAVLLHMMPMDRRSWAPLQQVLAKYGIASLALDLRGHGESLETETGQKLDYKNFDDIQHQQCLNDVQSALDWLVNKNYPLDRIMTVGASFGANLALFMLEQEPRLCGAVLLSPGDYRGMDAVEEASYVKPSHCLWAAASEGDDPEAFEAAGKIVEQAAADRKAFVPYKNAGHGIHLFTSDPKLMDALATWMRDSFQLPIQ